MLKGRAGVAAAIGLLTLASLLAPASGAAPACRATHERVPGGTWRSLPVRGLEGSHYGWRMAVDESDPRLVVVADFRGILVTRDGGCRWERTLVFDEVAPPLTLAPEDVDVGRSVDVVVTTSPDVGPRLLTSEDDGATWEISDLPPATAAGDLDTAQLTSGPRASYLLTVHRTGHGGVLAREDGDPAWSWRAVTTPAGPSGVCGPGDPCTGPPLRAASADPSRAGVVWALTAGGATTGRRLARSDDGGATWTDVPSPGLIGGPTFLEVASPGGLFLVDDFRHFAVSHDDGRSWQVGELPELVSAKEASGPVFDVAHTEAPATFAVLLGLGAGSPWAGNVLVFDGDRWTNASPASFSGYKRVDEEGRALSFVELTGSAGRLFVLSSRGELMSFRPR